ncbi:MAG TPA: hypothetical protein PKG60_02095 [Spirochaetota bacterium]|nr:hypothetical protein [Spirochaetota bacterium]HPS85884.1 hypothetical protein [Spirochaetota bacterium]
MAYHLLNIETLDCYYCEDHEWVNAIEIAKQNYWTPDGTFFDIYYDAEDQCFDNDDILYYNYMLVLSKNEFMEWEGSYFAKRNQVVMYEDSIYLASALAGSSVNPELVKFIEKGSFRICSE